MILISSTGTPCDKDGNDIPYDQPPPPPDHPSPDDYSPFSSRPEFEMADFLFRQVQMSGNNVDRHMELLAAMYPDTEPPYADARDMYDQIDTIPLGDSPWKSFEVEYTGPIEGDGEPPAWKSASYEIWHRDPLRVMENQLGNPDFAKDMDYVPKQVYKDGERQYTDLMSGNWAWQQAVSTHYIVRYL